jgi:23S rRNA pseudouridine1911/1915/1917 synthase
MLPNQPVTRLQKEVPTGLRGYRLDQVAALLFDDYSRARLQKCIRDGQLQVDGEIGSMRDKMFGGERLTLDLPSEITTNWSAQELNLDLVYEDDAILVVNKPAGLVVHPGAGNFDQTLLNGLLYHCPLLAAVPRAGIVHRLDKDTTGLLVVAKTLPAHNTLVKQLKARTVSREYDALVHGSCPEKGTVDLAIGRHPVLRTRMAVRPETGRPAITHYRLIRRYGDFSHLRVILDTGRTHQIRVHLTHIGHPLIGDPVYGGRRRIPNSVNAVLAQALVNFDRQALHASYLALQHPVTATIMNWRAAMPDDMNELLSALRSAEHPKG